MEDTEITCSVCGKPFLFSAAEQGYYAERGFQLPKRCRACRQARRRSGRGGGGPRSSGSGTHSALPRTYQARKTYTIPCSACETELTLAFAPRADAGVSCPVCFRQQHAS